MTHLSAYSFKEALRRCANYHTASCKGSVPPHGALVWIATQDASKFGPYQTRGKIESPSFPWDPSEPRAIRFKRFSSKVICPSFCDMHMSPRPVVTIRPSKLLKSFWSWSFNACSEEHRKNRGANTRIQVGEQKPLFWSSVLIMAITWIVQE